MKIDDLKVRKFKTTYFTLDRCDFEYIFLIREYNGVRELWFQFSDRDFMSFIVGLEDPVFDFKQYAWDNLEDIVSIYLSELTILEKEDPE